MPHVTFELLFGTCFRRVTGYQAHLLPCSFLIIPSWIVFEGPFPEHLLICLNVDASRIRPQQGQMSCPLLSL